MKKILLFSIFTILFSESSYSGWFPLNSGTTINLNKIQFVNSQTGWAGGFQSIPTQYILIKTTNGGINWFSQIANFPTGNRILSLCFVDVNTGFIAGGDGVFKTTNGGTNYSTLPPLSLACIDCVFINAMTGRVSVVTGNSEIYKTTNGGTNWNVNLYSSYQSPRYTYIRFADSNTGWCVNDSIFKTTNGGINWNRQVLPLIPFHNFYGVFAVSPDTAWVVGTSGIILSTMNGGVNWILKYPGFGYAVISAYFINSLTGYITTSSSGIYKTTNNGLNWIFQFSDTTTVFNSIYFTSKDTGFVCGSNGKIYKTTNGGTIGIKKINESVPEKFYLFQNYPNPFNPVTKIKFEIPRRSPTRAFGDDNGGIIGNERVVLKVYDILGIEVEILVNEKKSPGTYEVTFDGSRLASGIYFYKLVAGDFSETRKLILLK